MRIRTAKIRFVQLKFRILHALQNYAGSRESARKAPVLSHVPHYHELILHYFHDRLDSQHLISNLTNHKLPIIRNQPIKSADICPCDAAGFQNTMGAIHSTKIPNGPTGKRGPPQKVDRFFETFPVRPNRSIEFWTEISGKFG